jgi:hypothetical protein
MGPVLCLYEWSTFAQYSQTQPVHGGVEDLPADVRVSLEGGFEYDEGRVRPGIVWRCLVRVAPGPLAALLLYTGQVFFRQPLEDT